MTQPPIPASLLAEADRQLGEQRAQADAFAGRSGLMVAATAVLSGVATGLAATGKSVSEPFLWLIGLAAVTGVVIQLLARLAAGPAPTQLAAWGASGIEGDLLAAKLLAIEANGRALLRTEVVFWLQAGATVASLVTLATWNRG